MDGEDVRVARWAALLPSLVAHDEYADVEREDEDVNDEEGSGDVQKCWEELEEEVNSMAGRAVGNKECQ